MKILSCSSDCRILSRHVWHRGHDYGLAIVSVSGNDVSVEPFEGETPRTAYCDSAVRILRLGAQSPCDWHCPGDIPIIVAD